MQTKTLSLSVSKTKTYPRLQLINMQIRIALRRSTKVQESSLQSIEKGIMNKWINRVDIYGIDINGLCRSQLTIDIDWDEHGVQIKKGNVSITFDESWIDDTAIEIDEAIQWFNKYNKSKKLTTKWTVSYCYNYDADSINKQLGFCRPNPIQWATGNTDPELLQINEIPELKVGLKYIND